MAIEMRFEVNAGFHKTASPQIKANAVFQPATAAGKLNAEMTPTIPSGFQTSIIQWSGRSLGRTYPAIVLDMPVAISQISIYS